MTNEIQITISGDTAYSFQIKESELSRIDNLIAITRDKIGKKQDAIKTLFPSTQAGDKSDIQIQLEQTFEQEKSTLENDIAVLTKAKRNIKAELENAKTKAVVEKTSKEVRKAEAMMTKLLIKIRETNPNIKMADIAKSIEEKYLDN